MTKQEEDTLRKLWENLQERSAKVWKEDINEDVLHKLKSKQFITIKEDQVQFTEKGRQRARHLVRHYRLAERLLSDVLGMSDLELNEPSCQFEHKVPEEVEEAICTLLGHPDVCPHGKEIPPGACCRVEQEEVPRVIYRLTELHSGEVGKIAYIKFDGKETMRKLLSRGIHPGKEIEIIQTFPSYLIQVGATQIAVDEGVAQGIYVLREEQKHRRKTRRKRRGRRERE